jgi:hypothetical protein
MLKFTAEPRLEARYAWRPRRKRRRLASACGWGLALLGLSWLLLSAIVGFSPAA